MRPVSDYNYDDDHCENGGDVAVAGDGDDEGDDDGDDYDDVDADDDDDHRY